MASSPTEPAQPADSAARLRARCHENTIEGYRLFARTTPGGVIEERRGLVLINTQAAESVGNIAVATGPSADGSQLIAEAEAFFDRYRRPWILFALPEAVPSLELAARNRALRDEGRFPGLILDPIPESIPPLPEGVEVRRVDSIEELAVFERTGAQAYDRAPDTVDSDWLTYPGFSFHLAYFHGEPAATATLVASHGIAGIVYVGTVPSLRGRGLARSAVWSAIAAGVEEGCRTSALWATPMGRPMYVRMGFTPNTEYRIWSLPKYGLPSAFWAQQSPT